MNDTDQKKREFCAKLLDLYKKQEEKLKEYKNFIEEMIEKEDGRVFYQGEDPFSKEIEDAEKELGILLTTQR